MKQSLVLASNDLQDIERATGTCSRTFPSLLHDPFFSNGFLQMYYCNGEVSVQKGVKTDGTVSKISFKHLHLAYGKVSSVVTPDSNSSGGPGAKEAILHCLDPESICSRLPQCLSVHRAHHHLGSQVHVPKKLYCMVWIQRAHAAGCLITCDPVEANDFTPRNSAAHEHFDHARPQSFFSCCCSL
jgi:hypothetical protein